MSKTTLKKKKTRQPRCISVPLNKADYPLDVNDSVRFRAVLDEIITKYPQLFPDEIKKGYTMKDIFYSKKLRIAVRRIKIGGISYTIRPSFIMPYCTGLVNVVWKALFLRKFAVPFWAIALIFGKNPMYWFRLEQQLGRFPIVGTTVSDKEYLPEHLVADEKHTTLLGSKAYIACTAAKGCIVGVAITLDAGKKALQKAYSKFKEEAAAIDPNYSPKTVTTDKWVSTVFAWSTLYPQATCLLCFLHLYLSIRDAMKRSEEEAFTEISTRLWGCFAAESKASFSQRMRRIGEWMKRGELAVNKKIQTKVKNARESLENYARAYDFPGAYRTSNMIDRLMQRMDKHLTSTQYFHGTQETADRSIRGWALIMNFAPWNPSTVKLHEGRESPAENLNKFSYSDNWLENLLISAHRAQSKSPLNPL